MNYNRKTTHHGQSWVTLMKFYITQRRQVVGQGMKNKCKTFNKTLVGSNLADLVHKGDFFTWSNKHEDNTFTKERLDRAVANLHWMQLYELYQVESLVARSSDHKPICLTCQHPTTQRRPVVFRFEASWDVDTECNQQVEQLWNQMPITSNAITCTQQKLRHFVKGLKTQGMNKNIEMRLK